MYKALGNAPKGHLRKKSVERKVAIGKNIYKIMGKWLGWSGSWKENIGRLGRREKSANGSICISHAFYSLYLMMF